MILLMDTNTPFDDDFDIIPGAQLSGYINVADAPALSQANQYDLDDVEDEDDDLTLILPDPVQKNIPQSASNVSALSQGDWYDPDDEDDEDDDITSILSTPGQNGISQSVSNSVSNPSPASPGQQQPLMATRQWPYQIQPPTAALQRVGQLWTKFLSPRYIALVALPLVILATLLSGIFLFKGAAHSATANRSTVSMQKATQASSQAASPTAVVSQPTPVPTPSPTSPANTTVSPPQGAMPAGWTAAGNNAVDMVEALDVASTFVQRYNTIDARSPATLNAARFILTPGACQRFNASDPHHTAAFAARVQQQHLTQVASITGAHLVKAQQLQNKEFFAWAVVSYQLTMQQGDEPISTLNDQSMTVLLFQVPFNTPKENPPLGGIGWEVSNYGTGSALPAIPG